MRCLAELLCGRPSSTILRLLPSPHRLPEIWNKLHESYHNKSFKSIGEHHLSLPGSSRQFKYCIAYCLRRWDCSHTSPLSCPAYLIVLQLRNKALRETRQGGGL